MKIKVPILFQLVSFVKLQFFRYIDEMVFLVEILENNSKSSMFARTFSNPAIKQDLKYFLKLV